MFLGPHGSGPPHFHNCLLNHPSATAYICRLGVKCLEELLALSITAYQSLSDHDLIHFWTALRSLTLEEWNARYADGHDGL